jgi:ribosomal protein L12E/L44/L45/RPP1/RPP2
VDWFLDRFRTRQKARATLVCYLRENGPIAYGIDVFGSESRERADAMLSIDLTWYWKTTGPDAVARDWTHLTRWSLAALLEDLAAEHDGLKPHVLVVAVEGQDSPEDISDARVAASMRAFGTASSGPLHAVVSRPGPGGDLLFVAQQPPESIRNLLQAWGIDRDKAERRAYARLHGSALEDLIKSLGP